MLVRGGLVTRSVGNEADFSKGREIPSRETGEQDEDLGGVINLRMNLGSTRVGS